MATYLCGSLTGPNGRQSVRTQKRDNSTSHHSLSADVQDGNIMKHQSRIPTRKEGTRFPIASTRRKLLLGSPEEITSLDHRIGKTGGTTSSLDLLPTRLKIHKKTGHMTPAQDVYELTRQNGYLQAEVALLKETRSALRDLQAKAKEASAILRGALKEVSEKLAESEQRLVNYWGIHSDDGYEELNAF